MRKIEPSDVLDLVQYEKVRPEFQKKAIEAKAIRRVAVGPLITCFFENRLTMHYQLQEMLRVERIVRDEAIAEEMAVWNGLVPGTNELSMTLMVEIVDMSRAKEKLQELVDLEPTVSLRIHRQVGGERNELRVSARFEEGHRDENRISAVQYIRFALSGDDATALKSTDDVRIVIDHPAYRHEAKLPPATVAALREDLDTA
jgi:hypothetical protein